MENVNHPKHYQGEGIECIDAMVASAGRQATRAFCRLNAFKYLWRAEQKGKAEEDMKKARWYIDKYLELCKPEPALDFTAHRPL